MELAAVAPSFASVPEPDMAKRRPGRPPAHSGCQVCGKDLSDLRLFHQRYHICQDHMMSEEVLFRGITQRFCQQCGRFHELERFAPGMRSCRQQLAKHAERRRRGRAMAAAAASTNAAAVSHVQRQQQLAQLRQHQLLAAQQAHHAQLAVLLQGCPSGAADPEQPHTQPHSPRLQAGSSGSSESTRSTHHHSPSRPASPAVTSTSGMDALLAAAEEEACAEQEAEQAQKRLKLSPGPKATAVIPDLTWFQAPQPPTSGPGPAPIPLFLAAPAPNFPTPSANTFASAAQSALRTGWAGGGLAPEAASTAGDLLPAVATLPPMPMPLAVPPADLNQLLQQLLKVAMSAPAAAWAQQPLAPMPPGETQMLASFLESIQCAAQQREKEVQVQQLLQVAQARQDKEQQATYLFQAAVSGIMSGLVQQASR